MSRATLAVFALVLAGHGCVAGNLSCLQSGHLPEGKSVVLPSQRKNITTEGGQSMPLGIATPWTTSAQIFSNVMKIISEEVLGYHAHLSISLGSSSQAVYALGNCPQFPVDCLETEKARDPDGSILSQYHFAFEVWENYFRATQTHWEDNYPEKAPEVIGTVGYVGDEGVFVHPKSIDQGLAEDNLILDYYRGFNTSQFNATALSRHFTPLDRIDLSYLSTCDELMAGWYTALAVQSNLAGYHGQFPDDTTVSWNESADKYNWQCDYEGIWWLPPACRNEPLTCIPVVTYNLWGSQIMQQATYFNMPIAFASTTGECGWNCEWKEIVGIEDAMPPMTYWWFPDDMFLKSDLKLLAFPYYNKEEHEIGLAVSQRQSIPLRKLMAKGLGNIAGDLAFLGKEMWVPYSNTVDMLKSGIDGEDVSDLACKWVQDNTELWHMWLLGESPSPAPTTSPTPAPTTSPEAEPTPSPTPAPCADDDAQIIALASGAGVTISGCADVQYVCERAAYASTVQAVCPATCGLCPCPAACGSCTAPVRRLADKKDFNADDFDWIEELTVLTPTAEVRQMTEDFSNSSPDLFYP